MVLIVPYMVTVMNVTSNYLYKKGGDNMGKLTGKVINGVTCVLWHMGDTIYVFRANDMSFIGIL